ncbi:MAG TPA: pyrroloquinoline quinone biosynthesis protein PqqB [Steroidobacteraceae bacterium]|nr:pyrroloquinoline quinone biosynthesis protein PqqB [Steroidobacteraceae bacterium]
MKIRVLGSAAGGGFPQWNCNCRNCSGVRLGTLRTRQRSQSSIAIRGSAAHANPQVQLHDWTLVNASPDILHQLASNALQPGRTIRDSGIAAIVLTDSQIDHVTGLFMLREATSAWEIWCTDSVHRDLTGGNPVLSVLTHYCGSEHKRMQLGERFTPGVQADLAFTALELQSKPPPYSPNRSMPKFDDNVALRIVDTAGGGRLLYAPGLGAMSEPLWQAMLASDCVLVDGTFWTDDEMIQLGLSKRTARDIGHLPQTGAGGMLEWLTRLPAATRKILIHINNTNPILDEDSPERALLSARGIEVAHDGMEIDL